MEPEVAEVTMFKGIGPCVATAPRKPESVIADVGADAVSGTLTCSVKVMTFDAPGSALDWPMEAFKKEEAFVSPRTKSGSPSMAVAPNTPWGGRPEGFFSI